MPFEEHANYEHLSVTTVGDERMISVCSADPT